MKSRIKKRGRASLKVTLTAVFLAFSALLLVALWIVQTIFLDEFYKGIKTGQVKNCANAICQNIDSDDLSDLISDIENHNSMFVSIYDTTDTVITSVYKSDASSGIRSCISSDSITDYYRRTVKAGGEYSVITQVGMTKRFQFKPSSSGESVTGEVTEVTEAQEDEDEDFSDLDEEVLEKVYIPEEEENTPMIPAMPNDGGDGSNLGGFNQDVSPRNGQNADGDNGDFGQNGFQNSNGAMNDSGVSAEKNAVSSASAFRFVLAAVSSAQGGTASSESISSEEAPLSATEKSERPTDNPPDGKNGGDGSGAEPSLERESVENLAYIKLVSSGEKEYLVVVESEITPVTSVVSTLRYQLIIMTAVIVILSVVVALVIAAGIAKPLSDTNEKAKQLARQNYDVTFSGEGYKEIRELNSTLTYAASELGKVDSLRKELIANISHDLRTPLTMITGYSEVMRDLPGEVTPENIQIIIDEANHLNSLVTDLLDISRLESGTADVARAPFSLTNCIKSIFSRYTKLIEVEGFNITFEHDGEVFVMGDELRMTQVLYNLINNAINYAGEDKTVIVRQTVHDGVVKVEVIDHGEGIPNDKLEYIWDRYYRVDKEHKQAKVGTGLGLSIVKNILKAHGASFGVESELGKGSDFYFEMPVIETDTE